MDTARLDRIVRELPRLRGHVASTEEVSGGLINESVRLTLADGSMVVVRMFAANSAELGIDRDHEHACSRIAGELGVGARVLTYLPTQCALVLEWIEGEAQTGESLRVGHRVEQAARVLRRLHDGPAFAVRFSIFEILRRYQGVVVDEGYAAPPGFTDHLATVAEIERVLALDRAELRPCHNDVMPANFLVTEDGMRLIDYEYAGINDPAFDVGGLWQEAGLDLEHLERMVHAYTGGSDARFLARAQLWAIMWSYTWTLWAAIQAGSGATWPDWDPAEWGKAHFARARGAFAAPELERLLREAV